MIVLRDIKTNDKSEILKWRNSKEVSQFMYTDHQITENEHEQWFNRAINGENGYHWIVENQGKSIGLASITNIDKVNLRCSTGFYLYNPEPRKGLGTFVKYKLLQYSFDKLNMEKVYSEHFVFNKAIINLNKKLGLKQEGYFRKHAIKKGKLEDVVYMSILKSEWAENKGIVKETLKLKGLMK